MRTFVSGSLKIKHKYEDDIYVAELIDFKSRLDRNYTVYIEVEENDDSIEIIGIKVFLNNSEEISLTNLEEEELINKIAEQF